MSVKLTKFQKQLCNELQDGLPICPMPFDDLGRYMNSDEQTVLQQTEQLKNKGIIRRIGALVNYRTLGRTSTLVTVHVPEEDLKEITEAVNSLQNVSHNYLRQHYYNLWFTLQGQTAKEIHFKLSKLSSRFGRDFHSLPVKRVFKLDVRFDAENPDQLLSDDIEKIPKSEIVPLDQKQKLILSKLQNDLNLTSKPFDSLCGEGLEQQEVLRAITELIDKGVIRRIAAVIDYRSLGFVVNVMFCSKVPEDRIVQAGQRLARFRIVSHCYQRSTFADWPYNLFAMMHARSMGEIQHVVDKFIEAEQIDSFELLPTTAELKKQHVKHQFY